MLSRQQYVKLKRSRNCLMDVCILCVLLSFLGPGWPEGIENFIGFFPNTLEEQVAKNLPDLLRAKGQKCPEDSVVELDLMDEIRATKTA